MRERLVVAFVSVSLVTLVLFGVVRAYSLNGLIQHSEDVRVARSVLLVSTVLAERQRHDEPVTSAYLRSLLGQDEQLRYVDPNGQVVSARSSGYQEGSSAGASGTDAVAGGGQVTLERSRRVVDTIVSDALLQVVLLGVLLAALAALLGSLVARWLSRPFQELARSAQSLGRGRFDVRVPRFAMPEADVLGRALETSAAQLRDLMAHEREFVLTASHQLNTPVTALRLELEELAGDADLPGSATEGLQRAMGELDRLHASVGSLLTVARGHRFGGVETVDVAGIAGAVARRWSATSDRPVHSSAAVTTPLLVAAGPVEQALDGLVGHLLRRGAGPVRVAVGDEPDHVTVHVGDDSPSAGQLVPEPALDAVAAIGGHLSLDRSATTSYTIRLPRR